MWEVFLLRLMIFGYIFDMLMLWISLGIPLEVWIVGWVDTCRGCYFSYGYFDNYRYTWLPLDQVIVLAISVGTGFYALLMQQGWLSLWMVSMYVQWQWHNRRWDHSCLRCWIFWFCCGYQDGAHGIPWSMMVDVLGGIVPLFIYVARDWPYVMYTTSGRFLR